MSFAQLVQKLACYTLGGAIAQRIEGDAIGYAGERIAVFGARQNRSLIAQPPNVSQKHEHKQRAGAAGDADLVPGKCHCQQKCSVMTGAAKVTAGSRSWTCTSGMAPDSVAGKHERGLAAGGVRHSSWGREQRLFPLPDDCETESTSGVHNPADASTIGLVRRRPVVVNQQERH